MSKKKNKFKFNKPVLDAEIVEEKTEEKREENKKENKVSKFLFRFVQYTFEVFTVYLLIAMSAIVFVPNIYKFVILMEGINLEQIDVLTTIVFLISPAVFLILCLFALLLFIIVKLHKGLKKFTDKMIKTRC